MLLVEMVFPPWWALIAAESSTWDGLRHDLARFVRHRADPIVNTIRLTLEYLLATASKQPPAGM